MDSLVCRRVGEIFTACIAFLDDWKDFQRDDSGRPATDAQFWDLWEACLGAYEGGMRPREILSITNIIDSIKVYVDQKSLDQDDQEPGEGMWSLLGDLDRKISEFLDPEPPQILESVQSLMALDGMTHDQVARMYGWIRRDGSGDIGKVQEAINNPEILKSYKTPGQLEYEGKVADANQVLDAMRAGPISPERCPETPSELYGQGVPVPQAAKMLMLPEEDVQRLFASYANDRVFDPPVAATGPPVAPPSPMESSTVQTETPPETSPEAPPEFDDKALLHTIPISILRDLCDKHEIKYKKQSQKKAIVRMLDAAGVDWVNQLADAV